MFARDRIFVDSPLSGSSLTNVYQLPSSLGNIVHGSFVNNNKPKHFLTVSTQEGRHFVRTYTITEEHGSASGDSLPSEHQKRKLWKKLKGINPQLFYQWAEHAQKKEACSSSANAPLHTEPSYGVRQREEKELETLYEKSLTFIKTIQNTVRGQTELVLSGEGELLTVTLNKKSILLVTQQKNTKQIKAIEHWGGYYFLLYNTNCLGICKRALDGKIEEIKQSRILLDDLSPGISIDQFKVPKLEWSGRLTDILYKDFPTHVILAGSYKEANKTKSCVIKYNICKHECTAAAFIDSPAIVSCISYGPYDNGPVMIGLNDGTILSLDYYSLDLMFKLNAEIKGAVKWITYEPCNRIIVGTEESVYTLSLTGCARGNSEGIHVVVKHR